MTLATDLKSTLALSAYQRERIASKLSVSVSTVDRWAAGHVLPSARHQIALTALLQDMSPNKISQVAHELHAALGEAREVMHRFGLTSSRNDAIDQLAVLLLLQLFVTREVKSRVIEGDQLSLVLSSFRKYLISSFSQPVQVSLEKSITFLEQNSEYFIQLLECLKVPFTDLSASTEAKNGQFLHEVFVAFLSSSFHDEKEFAQYMTPPEIVDFMVSVTLHFQGGRDLTTVRVLDPSCGTGSFLTAFAERQAVFALDHGDRLYRSEAATNLFGIDTNERMARIASVSLVASGLSPSSILIDNSLAPINEDAKSLLTQGQFDIILTNPPFGAEHSKGNHGGKGIPSELVYLTNYIKWLKDDGVAAVIFPDSILTNKGIYANARSELLQSCDILAVISMPPVTFAASGTTTKTSVLVFRKKKRAEAPHTVVAVAENIGFQVSNRGSIRKRVGTDNSDLPEILDNITSCDSDLSYGKLIRLLPHHERWDAQFWTSPLAQNTTVSESASRIAAASVASLVREKIDPTKLACEFFDYIEISGVSGDLLRVSASKTPTKAAPSRARRHVKAGDVLISTVRPERRTVGVVPPSLDGAICSTGFGVLRPKSISPYALAVALRSDFATAQLIGVSSGVAYPAFDPDVLMDLEIDVFDDVWHSKCLEYGKLLEKLEISRGEILAD